MKNRVMSVIAMACAVLCWPHIVNGVEKFPETPSPPVMFLFPEFSKVPAVELALPPKYKAYRTRDPGSQHVYWGTTNGMNYYMLMGLANKDSPVFSVGMSANTPQSALTEEGMKKVMDERFQAIGVTNMKTRLLSWGQYPVFALQCQHENSHIYCAWVGLNEPTGETLLINYIFFEGRGHPTEKEREIWNRFLNETKELPPQYVYLTNGHDLHPGYTVVHLGPASFRLIAEVRKKDRVPLIAVTPLNEETLFTFGNMEEGKMEGTWNTGVPILKITGKVKAKEFDFDETATVMVKEVDEFTVDPSELKKNPLNLVFDGKGTDQGNPAGS